MSIQNLTSDEEFLRSYYLHAELSWFTRVRSELAYLTPSVLFAFIALMANEPVYAEGYLWCAVVLSVGAYIWRFSGQRWTSANASLIRKYEDHIKDLESR